MHNNNIKEVVTEYISRQTNYAFLISGKWGAGKTFFYKNTLVDTISNTHTISDGDKKYRPIHISLFGIKSVEEIQTQIFLSVHPLMKNKVVKLSLGFAKSISRGMLALKNLGDIDDYIADIKPKDGDWLKLDQLVICFDDLDRRDDSLQIKELIGFINSLTESEDAKIILIADEDNLEKSKDYKEFKEKVIGITVEFIPDFEENLKSIIDKRYSHDFRAYTSFLMQHLDAILKVSNAFEDNLRILIFTLDKLHVVFSQIETSLPKEKKQYFDKSILEIIQFLVAISIEYKNHKITFSNRNSLDRQTIKEVMGTMYSQENSSADQDEKDFKEGFIDKYYEGNKRSYKFFESLYSFITGAKPFILNDLVSEIDLIYNIKDGKIPEHYICFNKLNYSNDHLLSEKEYRILTRKMITYCENGDYLIGDYLTVFVFALRFDNLLRYNSENLAKRVKKGMNKSISSTLYHPSLGIHLLIPEDAPFKKELFELREFALALNDKAKEIDEKNRSLKLLSLIGEDLEKFKSEIFRTENSFHLTPIFKYAKSSIVYSQINKMTNAELMGFSDIISSRYYSIAHTSLKTEIEFWTSIANKLKRNSKSRQKKTIKNYRLNFIRNNVEILINKLTTL